VESQGANGSKTIVSDSDSHSDESDSDDCDDCDDWDDRDDRDDRDDSDDSDDSDATDDDEKQVNTQDCTWRRRTARQLRLTSLAEERLRAGSAARARRRRRRTRVPGAAVAALRGRWG
jgi:hypothetical protein